MADQEKKMLPCPKIVREQQELTPEQYAYARHFAQESEAFLLSTTVIDEAEAEMHLRQVYDIVGLRPPQVRWFDSPMAFLLAFTPPKMWEGLTSDQDGWLSGSEWKRMRAKLGASVDNQVWKSLEDSLGASQQDLRDWEHLCVAQHMGEPRRRHTGRCGGECENQSRGECVRRPAVQCGGGCGGGRVG